VALRQKLLSSLGLDIFSTLPSDIEWLHQKAPRAISQRRLFLPIKNATAKLPIAAPAIDIPAVG